MTPHLASAPGGFSVCRFINCMERMLLECHEECSRASTVSHGIFHARFHTKFVMKREQNEFTICCFSIAHTLSYFCTLNDTRTKRVMRWFVIHKTLTDHSARLTNTNLLILFPIQTSVPGFFWIFLSAFTRLIVQMSENQCPAQLPLQELFILARAIDWSNMPRPANVRAAKVHGSGNMTLNLCSGEMKELKCIFSFHSCLAENTCLLWHYVRFYTHCISFTPCLNLRHYTHRPPTVSPLSLRCIMHTKMAKAGWNRHLVFKIYSDIYIRHIL